MRQAIFALAVTTAGLLHVGAATAQERLKGTFSAVGETSVTLRQEAGDPVELALPASTQFARLAKAAAADLKPGLFVGVGARPQADGSQKAVQIVIFPESMRGVGEGHRAWGVMPEATMTNGAIAETVQSVDGPNFTLSYKGGAQKVTTPANASILILAPASRSDLKSGARGQAIATKAADGTITATRITVWGEGVEPY